MGVLRLVRQSITRVLSGGLPPIAQYALILAFVCSRVWVSWQPPSWGRLLPDRREEWGREDYPPLEEPGKQIRLIDLFPGTGSEELEARLFTATFLELPFYEAISYTWGDPNASRTMTMNGKRFSITDNLWVALKSIRTAHTNRTIWVDAVCIDQLSDGEKSHQVGLMSHIYERAHRVLVSLAKSPHPNWVLNSAQSQWNPDWALREADMDWPSTAHWLHSMVDQEFWKRCWIVQEVRQARTIHVYFGSDWQTGWMPWSAFVKLLELYRARESFSDDKIDRIFRLSELRRAKYSEGYALDQLLQEFGDCFCSVQLDRIYAFLGIADDEPGRYFKPNYAKSTFQLYADLLAFYDGSGFHRDRRDINMVHFAGLVRAIRAILSRKQSSQPRTRHFAKFGVDPGTWGYHVCKRFPDSCERQGVVLEGVAALLNIFYLYRGGPFAKQNESVWLPQDPESTRDWFPFFRRDMMGPLLTRGYLSGRVIKIGPTYESYIADPRTVNLWVRDTMDAVFSNLTLLRQGTLLNKKLVTILGDPEEFKIRNFVQFKDRRPWSYQKSRVFLGTDANGSLIMGLAPLDTTPDARLIQFWNTDAALVLIPRENQLETSIAPASIIGRAGIVKCDNAGDLPNWDKPSDMTFFLPTSELSYLIPMSVDMLTELSFDTVVLPGTFGDFEYSSWRSPLHWGLDL